MRVLIKGIFDNASKKAQWLVRMNCHINLRSTFTEGVYEENQFLRPGHGGGGGGGGGRAELTLPPCSSGRAEQLSMPSFFSMPWQPGANTIDSFLLDFV